MPYRRTYHPSAKRFETVFHGLVSADEIERNYREIITSPDWGPDSTRLAVVKAGSDLSDLTLDVFETRFVPLLEEIFERTGGPGKNAWVIESDTAMPIIRVWEMMPQTEALDHLRAFRTRQEALSWLRG